MGIAVLGGGNGSLAAAVDLTEQGHDVRLWRRDPAVAAATANLINSFSSSLLATFGMSSRSPVVPIWPT